MQGATEMAGIKVDGIVLHIVGPISVLPIQTAVSVGNTEESVGLGALPAPEFAFMAVQTKWQ